MNAKRLAAVILAVSIIHVATHVGGANGSFSVAGGGRTAQQLASRVCRPGPPLLPPTDGRKNCLVIGDSVSIGYTPVVMKLLNASECQVQHGPYSSDGGALDTKYAMVCLDQWLKTTLLQDTHYDAIVINSGLHDVNYSGGYPEEYTSPDDYKTNLQAIKERLLAHTPHVALVTTTPVGYDVAINNLVLQYNEIAMTVMNGTDPKLSVIDLYGDVIKVCGKPPYNCPIQASPKNVHYNSKGYDILGGAVASGFRHLLSSVQDENKEDGHLGGSQRERHHGKYQPSRSMGHVRSDIRTQAGVLCPGGKMACPNNTTCTVDTYSTSGYGCCYATPQPIQDCHDNWHCCPHGWQCGSCSLHGCMCTSA